MKTLIIIPAHNEAENIIPVIHEVQTVAPGLDLLLVDDGSSDATGDIAKSLGVNLLRLPFNLGNGAAVQTGFIYAVENDYDACILMDGDGQHNPSYIQSLIAPVANGTADIVIGSRFLESAGYAVSPPRLWGNRLFSKVTSRLIGQRITDTTSGFRVIGRGLLEFLARDNYPADYPDADTLIRLHYAGYRIQEVPVTMRPRLRGQSMHRGVSVLYYLYKMLFSIFIALSHRQILREGRQDAD